MWANKRLAQDRHGPSVVVSDALLSFNDREEALSRAYVQAVAADAGYAIATWDFDRGGIDVEVKAGGSMRPSLGLQLKATINLNKAQDGRYRFALPRRNYDLLREPSLTPRLLVVLDLPQDRAQWFTLTPENLVLRRCAYWVSLAGAPETTNTETVTVSIDPANRLDTSALRALMEQARTGRIL